MVVNAPQSNIVSAAELAVGLLLAAARHIPPANAAAEAGRVEAQQVHRRRALREDRRHRRPRPDRRPRRAAAVGVRHARHRLRPVRRGRPRRPDGRAAGLARRAAARRATSSRCTCPRRPETVGLIGDEQLATVKPSADPRQRRPRRHRRRGTRSTRRSRRAGSPAAGLDVFATEPCTDSPLFELEQRRRRRRTSAPAPTRRRRRRASSVARSVRLALAGELVPDAVNVQGGVIAEDVRPGIPLAEKLGRFFTALAGARARAARRRGARRDRRARRAGARAGRAQGPVHRRRRGPGLLRQRAACSPPTAASQVRLTTDAESPDYRNLVTAARHPGRRHPGLGVRHADRHPARREARRDRRLRRRGRARPSTWRSSATRTGPASSARSGGSSARPASTSPACRSAATARGGHALVAMTVDSRDPGRGARRDRRARSAPRRARQVDLTD